MTTNAGRLRHFHQQLDGQIPDHPTLPPAEVLHLRRTLLTEEFNEVLKAFAELEEGQTDLAPLMHELADLLYVAYGTFAVFGVDADAVFEEIHQANMRKLAGPRRPDGKLLKPAGWQPADVGQVLSRMKDAWPELVEGRNEVIAALRQAQGTATTFTSELSTWNFFNAPLCEYCGE